jgi:hypothetical protein
MAIGSGLAHLRGYPFEVRYSEGSLIRARAAADIAADAYVYFRGLFPEVSLDIALVVADEIDWAIRQPYGLPFFNDDDGQIRPGIIVMPAGSSDFWTSIGEDLRETSPRGYSRLLATYPDGAGGLDLQPFFDLVTIHELAHAFEVLGDLGLPKFWLGEIFANLALHAFIATRQPEKLDVLRELAIVGESSPGLDARVRTKGYTSLEDLEAHYTGGESPMSPLNCVWYQYRWQRLVAHVFEAEGEDVLTRLWNCFHAVDRFDSATVTTASLGHCSAPRCARHWVERSRSGDRSPTSGLQYFPR